MMMMMMMMTMMMNSGRLVSRTDQLIAAYRGKWSEKLMSGPLQKSLI